LDNGIASRAEDFEQASLPLERREQAADDDDAK
jgi:hypothetical protein